MFHPLKTLVLVILVGNVASAAEWTTSDGKMSVDVPKPARFAEVDPIPPLSVIWVSNDETVRLAVTEIPFRPETKLIRSSVEKGLAEELDGEIVASSAEQQAGHDVFLMTGRGKSPGTEVYITQAVAAVGSRVYKVMAVGMGKDTRLDPDAAKFIASFKILKSNQVVDAGATADVRDSQQAPTSSRQSLVDLLSERIGGISALILIVCVIVIFVSRSAKRRKSREDNFSITSGES